MKYRLPTIFFSLLILAAVLFIRLKNTGWPEMGFDQAYRDTVDGNYLAAQLMALVMGVAGVAMLVAGKDKKTGEANNGSAAESPDNSKWRRETGLNLILAAGVVLLVGVSVCMGELFL